MIDIEVPVCGTVERLKLLTCEFLNQIENCISAEEIKFTVAWYFAYGYYLGFMKEWLLESILNNKELYYIAEALTGEEILRGRKPPSFREGDIVEVIVNVKNTTYHKGIIDKITYHFKETEWNYYINENNKKVSKRYYYKDLRLIEKASNKGRID